MARNFSIKDPNCLRITIVPWANGFTDNLPDNAGAFGVNRRLGNNRLDLNRLISLQGVFAEDGSYATLESTVDEDEFTETADGSICVFTRGRNNEILTIRLNSCSGYVELLTALKNIRSVNIDPLINPTGPVPLYIHVCDLCTGYSLVSDCAWILSNPSISFGNDEDTVEIRILMSNPRDNRLAIDADAFQRIQSLLGNAVTGITP